MSMSWLPLMLLMTLWAAWVLQAVLSAIQVGKLARALIHKKRDRHEEFRPFVTVIVPFKGLEPGLREHLRGLFEQDYPRYELLLVVDSVKDPAYDALVQEAQHHPADRATILVAGPAGPEEGQKVHNQLFAIDHLDNHRPDATEDDAWVWVFADSDAVPGPRWLADMVGPLAKRDKNGMTTGYRWLIPTGDPQPTIWSHLTSVINSSVACFDKGPRYTRAWGGSMALLAQTAKQGRLREHLVGALCDDYQFTRIVRQLGLRVYFVPWCLVATPVDLSLSDMLNFAHRQYVLTRVYARDVYLGALMMTSLYMAGLASAWGWSVVKLWQDPQGWAWRWPVAAIVAVGVVNQVRHRYRRQVVRRALGEDLLATLKPTLWWDRWVTPIWMGVHWLLVVRSAFGRVLTWRGISYNLQAPQQVRRLTPDQTGR